MCEQLEFEEVVWPEFSLTACPSLACTTLPDLCSLPDPGHVQKNCGNVLSGDILLPIPSTNPSNLDHA